MNLQALITKRLTKPLPGFEAQRIMGPTRADGSFMHNVEPPPGCRTNAVMMLLYKDGLTDSHHMVFTIRSAKMPTHAGEISCPGGRIEDQETPLEAAFRETNEEVGIRPDQIAYAGRLSRLYIPVTNNIIYPHVGFIRGMPTFTPDPREVSSIITPRLSELLSPDSLKHELWTLGENQLQVPFWDINRVPLWGATAMIVSEFIELLKDLED